MNAEPPCPLLDKLPPELRNEIYVLAFADDTHPGVAINLLKANPSSNGKALIQTCRQINSEARNLYKKDYQAYWTSNSFQIRRLTDDSFENTMAALDRVPEESLCRISRLEFYQEWIHHAACAFMSHTYRLVDTRGAWLREGRAGGLDEYHIIGLRGQRLYLPSREELAAHLDSDKKKPSMKHQIERLLWRTPR